MPPPASTMHHYPCPGCGADLIFEPEGGLLECPYCGRQEVLPQTDGEIAEHSYDEYLEVRPERLGRIGADALQVDCEDCGAPISFTPPDVAGDCAFCGTPLVAQPRSSDPLVAPSAVLPFAVDADRAGKGLRDWFRSIWFAPRDLQRRVQHDSIAGIYLPFWTYDAWSVGRYLGERGEHYLATETARVRSPQGRMVDRERRVRRTRWHPASGEVSRWFDDVLIPATTSLDRDRLRALEPWDLDALVPYGEAYLAGFRAQRYTVDLAQGFEHARAVMHERLRSDARSDIGGDDQRVHELTATYSGITFKHILLPVWAMAYRYRKKTYQVVINARTGEVLGDRPYSVWKIIGLVLSIATVVTLVAVYGQ